MHIRTAGSNYSGSIDKIKIQSPLWMLQVLYNAFCFVAPTLPLPLKSSSSGPVWDSGPARLDTCPSHCPDRVALGSHDHLK